MCLDVVFCNSYATIHTPVGDQHGARQDIRGATREPGKLQGGRVQRSGARGIKVRDRKAKENKQKGKGTCMKERGVSWEAVKRIK
ncbi:hypothetical protein BBBOND_0300720 [Babesia bigemina]|uniref:Uncharacterized protein n=1 Tax=Babesia bigemina TaxID=5866 RepID=A0A061D848_BABBI|nr:hypothetical protein BBBOND_0300720 [Babesia bigemina]CDR96167.1 hypothetical protein BBBOND_0300720 [Babesia bigemina]|eukprot:XP_012768353.1 hypothetical protein BBBOND_0300720 [Babesia bigemina]